MNVEQAPSGRKVEIPAGETRTYADRVPASKAPLYVTVVEYVASTAGAIEASCVFVPDGGTPMSVPREPNDADDPEADAVSTNYQQYPIVVDALIGQNRYLMLVRLDADDRIEHRFNNPTTNAENVTFRHETASTLRAALASQGGES